MKYPYRLLVAAVALFIFCPTSLFAQDDEYGPRPGEKPDTIWFNLNEPAQHPSKPVRGSSEPVRHSSGPAGPLVHSLYSHLEILDQRRDTSLIGLVEDGTYYDVRVLQARPMGEQFAQLMARLTDSASGQGTLLLQLEKFYIYSSDEQHAAFRMNVYALGKQGYQELEEIDTLFTVGTGMLGHHGKKIVPVVSKAVWSIMAGVLSKTPDPAADHYTYAEVRRIDEVKMSRLPLYRAGDSLLDGVYLNFKSFLQLRPDYTRLLVDTVAGWERANVTVATPATPSEPVGPGQIYAFVKDGRAWISTGSHYHLLQRDSTGFYSIAKISVESQSATDAANMAEWAVFFASAFRLPLTLVYRLTVRKKFILQLDYRNGSFVPMRPLE